MYRRGKNTFRTIDYQCKLGTPRHMLGRRARGVHAVCRVYEFQLQKPAMGKPRQVRPVGGSRFRPSVFAFTSLRNGRYQGRFGELPQIRLCYPRSPRTRRYRGRGRVHGSFGSGYSKRRGACACRNSSRGEIQQSGSLYRKPLHLRALRRRLSGRRNKLRSLLLCRHPKAGQANTFLR